MVVFDPCIHDLIIEVNKYLEAGWKCTLISYDPNKESEIIELKYNCFQNKVKKSFKLGNTI